jgi:plasmid stabilization system protein ParE
MRRVVWSEEARENLKSAQVYISGFNVSASRRLALRIIDLTDSLKMMPDRGRLIRSGVRELTSVRPYVIRYAVLPGEVRILSVRHSALKPQP